MKSKCSLLIATLTACSYLVPAMSATPVHKSVAAKKNSAPSREGDTRSAINYFNQGVSATDSKNYLQAIQFYKAAREADPAYVNAYVNETSAYLALNRADLAIDVATKGLALCNKNDNQYKMCWEVLHHSRGSAYELLKQPQKAISDFNESLLHDVCQRGCITQAQRGLCYVEVGDYNKAAIDFNAVLQSSANDSAMQNAKVIADAGRKLMKARMQMDTVQALTQCKVALGKNDFDKAISAATTAVNIDPTNLDALLVRTTCYAAKHLNDKADADLKTAEKLSPNNGMVAHVAGVVHLSEGEADKSIGDFQSALAKNYSSPQLYLGMSAAQLQLSKFDDALKSVNEAIRLSPNDAEAYNIRSLVYLVTDTPQNSIADANAYLEKTSWKGKHASDSVLRIYLLSKQLEQKDAADKILESATTQMKLNDQAQTLISFLQGKTDEAKFSTAAVTPGQKTDAQVAIAVKAVVEGDITKAEKLLKDVQLSGVKNSDFYLTGIVELAKMTGVYKSPKVKDA